MARLKIYKDNNVDSTVISNRFIDEYMKDANDAQLKVYLYLIRMLNANQPTSVMDIADKFNHTEREVNRSLKYWETQGLLELEYDIEGNLAGIHLRDLNQANNSISRNNVTLSKMSTPIHTTSMPTISVPMSNASMSSIPMNGASLSSAAFGNASMNSIPMNNTSLSGTTLGNTSMSSMPMHNIALSSTTLGNASTNSNILSNASVSSISVSNASRTGASMGNSAVSSSQTQASMMDSSSINSSRGQASMENSVSYENTDARNSHQENEYTQDNTFVKPSYSADQLKAFKNNERTAQLLFVVEQYIGKPLSPSEMKTILFFTDVLNFSDELIDYLIQYCVDRGKKDFKYIEKVAISWAEDNVTTPKQAEKYSYKYDKNVYAIMNELGKNGSPTAKELEFIKRWTKQYGFTNDIIFEACERTVMATDRHRFEYAESILSSWYNENVHHKTDISKIDDMYQKKKASKNFSGNISNQGNTNKFNQFTQNNYDFAELEKELLSN